MKNEKAPNMKITVNKDTQKKMVAVYNRNFVYVEGTTVSEKNGDYVYDPVIISFGKSIEGDLCSGTTSWGSLQDILDSPYQAGEPIYEGDSVTIQF